MEAVNSDTRKCYPRRLLSAQEEIRLFRVARGFYADALSCTLVPVYLEELERKYKCLSWAWGAEEALEDWKDSFVNNDIVKVRTTLYPALTYLRKWDDVERL